jgi:DNA adenine methylase
MKELIDNNSFKGKPAYVEPSAGGAGVALGLLIDGYVSEIYINDIDPAIYSFWSSIKHNHEILIDKIRNTEITIEEWHKQKEIYKTSKISFNLGFSVFFLNRCNRSGVIKGGCIGGLKQDGKYKIDCRFNKEDLIKRIQKIAEYKDKIHIYRMDTYELLRDKELKKKFKNCLLYLDPPYYEKGYQLYENHYKHDDHKKIADVMRKLKGHWVVSYDNVIEIKELYSGFNKKEFNLTYFAGAVKKGKEIMFFSDKIPLSTIPLNI